MDKKFLVCCGNGVGSSMIMKIRVTNVLKNHDIKPNIDHSSLGDAKTIGKNYDVVLCPEVFKKDLAHISNKVAVIGLKNVLDENEIENKLRENNILS